MTREFDDKVVVTYVCVDDPTYTYTASPTYFRKKKYPPA